MFESVRNKVESKLSDTLHQKIVILDVQTLGGGCINHASKLETNAGRFFLKWNAHCPEDMFTCEAKALADLRKAVNNQIRIPEVICFKDRDHSPGFIVLEFLIEGHSGNDDEKLGCGLAEVHRSQGLSFGYSSDNYCGDTPQKNTPTNNWPDFFRDQRLAYLLLLIENKISLSASEKNTYDKLLDRIPSIIPDNIVPALIHGDLWSGNYLYTNQGPALIDPAAYYADREMEFAIITMFGGFSSRFFEAYNEAFPLDPEWRERNLLYQLYHILNHYYLFGGSYGNQALQVARKYL